MARRCALIIGNSDYDDPTLSKLKTPEADVRALAAALRDPNVGGFDEVQEIINQSEAAVSRAISSFFMQKKPEDMLLLYFSGHGVLDPQGRLFLAVKDTQRDLLNATGIPSSFITDDMDTCRSKRQLLILDCCHSGAFARGTKGNAPAVTKSTFEGNGFGRVVLTASDSTQYALEGDQVIEQAALSLFTHYLLEGLTTGQADSAQDGWVTLDEWYDYAYERVVSETPGQTPRKWVYNQQGELVIAKNPAPKKTEPKDLPQELQDAIASRFVGVRLEALQELQRIVNGNNPALLQAALQAVTRLTEQDDSRQVTGAASEIIASYQKNHPEGPFPNLSEAAASQEQPSQAELARTALEKQAKEKAAAEAQARAEAEKQARQRAEVARAAHEKAEADKLARQKAEHEREQPLRPEKPVSREGATFICELLPRSLRAGETGQLTISNRSDTSSASYSILFQDQTGELLFSASQSALQIPAGSSAVVQFRAQPRSPRWAGGSKRHPFTVQVTDGAGMGRTAAGELISEARRIPVAIWGGGLGALVILCLVLGFMAVNSMISNTRTAQATGTASSKETLIANVVAPTVRALTATAQVTPNVVITLSLLATPTAPQNEPTATHGIVLVLATPTAPLALKPTATSHPAAPPGRIVFSSDRDGNWEIYTMNADGGDVQRLTKHSADDSYPRWSPDGTRILFHSNREGNYDIFVMNLDGSEPVNLTGRVTQADTFANWSPDGKQIVFQSKRGVGKQIFVMNADGSDQRGITASSSNYEDSFPSWSPDGRQILFISTRNRVSGLFVMGTDGSNQQAVFADGSRSQIDPSWSPDGKTVVYVEWQDSGQPKWLATIALRASNIEVNQITFDPWDYSHPVFSPDGRYIYFEASVNNGKSDIYRYSVQDGSIVQITDNPASDVQPSVR